ncbi:VOC family protein [Actinoplanes sp. NPDC024001]|uniref:VOC family protein n=1 Tax=Actinoplanes sp. NPDC024001 TaxID=3154598 RepID=UPI0034030016
MLRKIDCVMVPVTDLEGAAVFYTRVFGLHELWRDDAAVGLTMPDTDAEIVLHTMTLEPDAGVHYLVDDVPAAFAAYRDAGCAVRTPPFDIAVGRCAVLEDPYGNAVCILDLTKGRRDTQTSA